MHTDPRGEAAALPLWRLRSHLDANSVCQPGDVDLFFGPDGESPQERSFREDVAARLCRECPVSAECLEFAVRSGEVFGVWGGVGEQERRAMIRERERRSAA